MSEIILLTSVLLAILWFILIDAVRRWTKQSYAELVKQTAILERIEVWIAYIGKHTTGAPSAKEASIKDNSETI